MALRKICDHCGAELVFVGDKSIWVGGELMVYEQKNAGAAQRDFSSYDLCPTCFASFVAWM